MKIYESSVSLRRVRPRNYNGYDTHAHVEKLVFEQAGIRTGFTYFSDLQGKTREVELPVRIRTQEPTKIAGEVCKEITFTKGQRVRFITRFLPYKNYVQDGGKDKRMFINDSIEREMKLISSAERAGLDIETAEELSITKTKFVKASGRKFYLSDVLYLVEAEITCPNLFEMAYLTGICAKPHWGYGMIMLDEGDQ